MKHLARYGQWLHESSESKDSTQQRLEDLKNLVDLGFAEPHELKAYYKQNYAGQLRQEFLSKLMEMFKQVGVTPIDLTTARQEKNGTYHFQLTPAQAEGILFGYTMPSGLVPRQVTRMQRRLQYLEGVRDEMRRAKTVAEYDFGGHTKYMSSRYEYWVYPGDVRNASFYGQSNSSPFIRFDGVVTGEEMLARFIYQLALDSPTDSHNV